MKIKEIITVVTTFLGLTDTPSSYTSQAGKLLKVNATPDGIEFGETVSTDGTLASNSDSKVPTEKAVKTYVDALFGGGGMTGNIQVYTSGSGNFTVPANVTKIKVYCTGGGGGGGSAVNPWSAGGGGGGGGTAIKFMTVTPGQVIAYSVGNGGAPGMNGQNSTFGALIGGGGNAGGQSDTASNTAGRGGTASGGDLNINGSPGGGAIYLAGAANIISSGHGGSSFFGGGASPVTNDYAAGNYGTNYGGGGSGGATSTPDPWSGGSGSAGVIVIEW